VECLEKDLDSLTCALEELESFEAASLRKLGF